MSGMFSTPKMPKVELPKPQAMPTLDDPARLANIRERTIARSRRGRAGTIFSRPATNTTSASGTTVSSPSYSNTTLGGAV